MGLPDCYGSGHISTTKLTDNHTMTVDKKWQMMEWLGHWLGMGKFLRPREI